jgi:LysM repeat protein
MTVPSLYIPDSSDYAVSVSEETMFPLSVARLPRPIIRLTGLLCCLALTLAGWLMVGQHQADAVGAIGAAPPTYTVKPGDTLSALAVRFDTTVAEMASLNNLTDHGLIRVGTRLRLPRKKPVNAASSLPARLARNQDRLALRAYTAKWAKKNGIPVDLLEATLWLESGFDQKKVSSTGAIGVGQLMPETSAFISGSLIGRRLDPHDVEDNIRMSARYLWYLLRMHGGDSTKALHAYYQGQGSIGANGLYHDTIQYARNIQALRRRFR